MAKVAITVIQQREWTGKQQDALTGEFPHCYFYAGFLNNNQPLEFKSNRENITVHEGVMKFDKDLAEEFELKSQFDSFKGKMKFVEVEE